METGQLMAEARQPIGRFLACLLLLATPGAVFGEESAPLIRYEATADLMGCTFGVAAYGAHRDSMAHQVEAAFEQAREIDNWLSNYRDDSELSRLNRTAANTPVPVPNNLFDLLEKSIEFSRASEGAFDMTVGPLVRAWGFYDGAGNVPNPDELERARDSVGYQLVELNPASKTVRFTRAGVELDPGGIGKGYAVDRMVEVLRRGGVQAALVNGCHSSIYALGAPPESPRGWPLEIDNPAGGAEQVLLKDQSLSTSGSQEKFFEAEGHVYSHILDPRTGRPAEGLAAVSVIAPTALESEVWSTAVFVNGLDWASRRVPSPLEVYGCPVGNQCHWVQRLF